MSFLNSSRRNSYLWLSQLSLSLSLSLSVAHSHGRDDLSVSALVLLHTQPQCEAIEAFISKPFTPLQGTLFLYLSQSWNAVSLSLTTTFCASDYKRL